MSVRSATISGYRSEDSLALGGGSSTSGMVVGLPGVGGVGGGSGRLGSLPSSPFVQQGGDGVIGGGGIGDGGRHPHSRTSKSNSFSSHVRLHDKERTNPDFEIGIQVAGNLALFPGDGRRWSQAHLWGAPWEWEIIKRMELV